MQTIEASILSEWETHLFEKMGRSRYQVWEFLYDQVQSSLEIPLTLKEYEF